MIGSRIASRDGRVDIKNIENRVCREKYDHFKSML